MTRLTIRALGSLTILLDERPLPQLKSRTARALLVYLAVRQRPYPRDVLADFFWDDRSAKQAAANLRAVLSMLRKALPEHILITRQTVAFNTEADYELDVLEFERLEIGDHCNLQSLISLYHGDFLEGFYLPESRGFMEWTAVIRERLRRQAALGLRQLADDSLENGRYPQGLRFAEQLINLDNLDEQPHRQKMLLLARSGQRNAALRQYRECRRLLAEELDVEPAPATTALHERLRGLTFPPPADLPPPPAPFIGRNAELAALRRLLLNPAERLITLLGPGGIGKSRLALETARQIVAEQPGRFLDGIFYAPLTAVTNAQQLPNQIAHALGFTFQGTEPRQTQLVNTLRPKESLLVLDNFEQLLRADENGAALIAKILNQTNQITLLVTSRERLNLYEETIFTMAGLDVPPDEAAVPEQYSAVQLFLQRAARIRRDCAPAPEELAAIVRVCRLLRGMPLAIELAAGWIRQHTFAEIEAQLAADLDFLQTSLRNIPSRQRSLRAVFDHSWQLLTGAEQIIFIQLAVFPDSFTLEAAQAVLGGSAAPLAALTDKSLLEREANGRFQIHPVLRQYALEKLTADKEMAAAAAQRHAAYYLNFIEQQESGESITERAAIRQELPNIQAAWKWVARHQDYAALDRIVATLHNFFNMQSWFHEGIDLFQFALAQMGETTDPAALTSAQAQTLCDLWAHKARLHIHIGQLQEAETALAQAGACLSSVDDPGRRSTILNYLSMTNFYAGRYEQAIALLKEALQLALQADDMDGAAFTYNFLGSSTKAQGKYTQAGDYFTQALDTYRQLGDEIGAGVALHNLGNLAQATGDYETSRNYYQQSAALFQANDYTQGAATASSNAGRLALQTGDFAEAERLLAEALRLKEQINDKRGMAVALVGLGAVAAETAELPQSRAYLARGLALAQESGDVKLLLEGIVVTAVYAHRLNQSETASELIAFVLNHPATVQEVRQQAEKLAADLGQTADPPPQELDDLVTTLLDGLLASE